MVLGHPSVLVDLGSRSLDWDLPDPSLPVTPATPAGQEDQQALIVPSHLDHLNLQTVPFFQLVQEILELLSSPHQEQRRLTRPLDLAVPGSLADQQDQKVQGILGSQRLPWSRCILGYRAGRAALHVLGVPVDLEVLGILIFQEAPESLSVQDFQSLPGPPFLQGVPDDPRCRGNR